jgi:transcriptional regulator with XRE-family HTH domain
VELGERLRAARKARGITLQQVAERTGLSKSFVSQVETGVATPSIVSLVGFARALDVPVGALIEGLPGEGALDGVGTHGAPSHDVVSAGGQPRDVKVVRRDARKTLGYVGAAGHIELLTPDLQRQLEVILTEEPHGSASELYSHEGEEFGLVLEGRYEVTVADQTYVLEEGDTISFPSVIPHRTRALGEDGATRTLWVITPPSF